LALRTNVIGSCQSIHGRIVQGKITVDEVVKKYQRDFELAAHDIINEWEERHSLNEVTRRNLKSYLMICLDVYTYSEMGDVMIPDWTYDRVMTIWCDLTSNERLSKADYIQSKTIWSFVKHEAPFMVGTISRKIYDLPTLEFFLKELRRDGYRRLLYAPKFDGISSAVTLKDGKITRAVTRNNGVEGQDITDLIVAMNRVKKIFDRSMPDGYYKCELVVTTADLDELTKIKPYKNRRSAASAIVSTPSNIMYAEYLTALPLAWVNFEGSRLQYLAWKQVEAYVDDPTSFDTMTVYDNIERILAHIRSADYPVRVDGVVIFPVHDVTSEEPNTVDLMANALAYKVNTQENRTTIDHVYVSVGRMGIARPMAKVTPVEVNETIVQDVSIGSWSIFGALNLHEHEDVIVYSAGDVIPQIKMPEPRNYPRNAKRIQVDMRCPYCGHRLQHKNTDVAANEWVCGYPKCNRVVAGRIVNFLDKLDIAEGFRDQVFFKLAKDYLVQSIDDLFTLQNHYEELVKSMGSQLQADKLLDGLKELTTKKFEVSDVIGALGIDGIGPKTCKAIFADVTLDSLLELKKNRIYFALLGIPNIGDATAKVFSDFLIENHDLIEFLQEHMNITDDSITYGNIVFTGFRNKDYAEIFKTLGFPTRDSITTDTVAVVYAGDTTSTKAKKAIQKNIPLVHFGQIDDLVDEIKRRRVQLENQNISYGKGSLVRDISRNVRTYSDISS